MSVYESDIPGVGRRFELELGNQARAVVVLHHDGRCELFYRADEAADGEKLLDLTSEQANKLGSILEGAYFESVDLEELSVPLGDAIIEWLDVPADSPLVGASLGEADIRDRTGTSVVAVRRGEETVPNPDASFEITAGDLLVAIGTREEITALTHLVEPDASGA